VARLEEAAQLHQQLSSETLDEITASLPRVASFATTPRPPSEDAFELDWDEDFFQEIADACDTIMSKTGREPGAATPSGTKHSILPPPPLVTSTFGDDWTDDVTNSGAMTCVARPQGTKSFYAKSNKAMAAAGVPHKVCCCHFHARGSFA
jgi:hypothetical protein